MRIEKRYKITAFNQGLNMIITARYQGKEDTVFFYKYGAYYGATVKDAAIHEQFFICVYDALDMDVCIVYENRDGKWYYFTDKILFSYGNSDKRIKKVKIDKNKIELISDTKTYKYKIDFEKKIFEKCD